VSYEVEKPFSTVWHQLLFLGLLLLVLASPVLGLATMQPRSAASVYKSVPLHHHNYYYIGQELQAGGPADVIFIGASDVWTAFDANTLTTELERLLGRKVRVMNFGTNWYGADMYYLKVFDLLSSIKPKLVVIADVGTGSEHPHLLTKFVWRYGDVPLPENLGFRAHAALYGAVLLGSPYRVWSALSPAPERASANSARSIEESIKSNGHSGRKSGFLRRVGEAAKDARPYVEQNPEPVQIPVDDMFYKDKVDESFSHYSKPYTAYQSTFMLAMNDMVTKSGGVFVTASIPTHFKTKPDETAKVRLLHNKQKRPWPHIGIPMSKMLHGRTFEQMVDFYYNESHLNASGARLFTRTIAPAIAKVLSDADKK
jgi:hypothetical protein